MFKQLTLCALILSLSSQNIEARPIKHIKPTKLSIKIKQSKPKYINGVVIKKVHVPIRYENILVNTYDYFEPFDHCYRGNNIALKTIPGGDSIQVAVKKDTFDFYFPSSRDIDSIYAGDSIRIRYFDEYLRVYDHKRLIKTTFLDRIYERFKRISREF